MKLQCSLCSFVCLFIVCLFIWLVCLFVYLVGLSVCQVFGIIFASYW